MSSKEPVSYTHLGYPVKRDIGSDAEWLAAREAEEDAWQAYVDGGRSPRLGEAYEAATRATDAARDAFMEGK